MSKLTLLGKDKQTPENEPATKGMLMAAYAELRQENAALAVVLREFMDKLARVEDYLGITDESIAKKGIDGLVAPKGTPFSGVAKSALRDIGLLEPEPATPVVQRNGAGGDIE